MNKEVQVNFDGKKNYYKYFISINIFFMIIISTYLYGFVHISNEISQLSELINNGNKFFVNTNNLLSNNDKNIKESINTILYNSYLFNETLIEIRKSTGILTISTLHLINNTNNKLNDLYLVSQNKLYEVEVLINNMDNTINKFDTILNQFNQTVTKQKDMISNPQIPSSSTIGA